MKYTHKAPFDKGYNGMVSAVENPEMMGMEFGVVKMAAGDVMHFDYAQEVVYDLMSGTVTFEWNGQSETVTRKDVFHEGAILLHVPQNTKVTISAESDVEIAVSRTENKRDFAARLLRPEDCLCANEERGAGQMNECSTRLVRTFFDRSNCPETNFFIDPSITHVSMVHSETSCSCRNTCRPSVMVSRRPPCRQNSTSHGTSDGSAGKVGGTVSAQSKSHTRTPSIGWVQRTQPDSDAPVFGLSRVSSTVISSVGIYRFIRLAFTNLY